MAVLRYTYQAKTPMMLAVIHSINRYFAKEEPTDQLGPGRVLMPISRNALFLTHCTPELPI